MKPGPKSRTITFAKAPLEPPDYLDGEALEMFRTLAAQLANIITELDTTALARYCLMHQQWCACSKYIQEHGTEQEIPVFNRSGVQTGTKRRTCPEFNMLLKLSGALLTLGSRFGMTPLSRKRMGIKLAEGRVISPGDKFFRRGKA
jgi:P27 family predicted phage terminase small subunit